MKWSANLLHLVTTVLKSSGVRRARFGRSMIWRRWKTDETLDGDIGFPAGAGISCCPQLQFPQLLSPLLLWVWLNFHFQRGAQCAKHLPFGSSCYRQILTRSNMQYKKEIEHSTDFFLPSECHLQSHSFPLFPAKKNWLKIAWEQLDLKQIYFYISFQITGLKRAKTSELNWNWIGKSGVAEQE